MLKKLFYNDFHTIRRRILPLLLASLGCSACAFFVVLLDAVLPQTGDIAVLLDNTLTSVLVALLFAFIVLVVLSGLHIFIHYYRNFFTDEGYLTFMLPATREQLFVAKLLAGIVWTLIILLSAIASVTVGILLPTELLMRAENASFLSSLWRDIFDLFSVISIVDLLLTLIAQTVFIYTAITLGSLFFTKRKMLGSFISYFLLSGIISFLRTILSLLFYTFTDAGEFYSSLASILLSLSVGIGGYLITCALLKHKLNLV